MEYNKDEAERCIEISIRFLSKGDREKAKKFLLKSEKLYPSERGKALLEELELSNNASKGKPEEDTTRKKQTTAAPNMEGASGDDFTKEQLNLVNKIRCCEDYYAMLSIDSNATDKQIQKSYKKLALKLHPDKNRAPGAADAFKAIRNAVSVLMDRRKRRNYDSTRPYKEGPYPAHHHFPTNNFFPSHFNACFDSANFFDNEDENDDDFNPNEENSCDEDSFSEDLEEESLNSWTIGSDLDNLEEEEEDYSDDEESAYSDNNDDDEDNDDDGIDVNDYPDAYEYVSEVIFGSRENNFGGKRKLCGHSSQPSHKHFKMGSHKFVTHDHKKSEKKSKKAKKSKKSHKSDKAKKSKKSRKSHKAKKSSKSGKSRKAKEPCKSQA